MEPWLLENGGSGIIPDGARNNFGKTRPKESQMMSNLKKETKPFLVNDVKTVPGESGRFSLPEIDQIKPPTSADEAKRMFQLGKDLLASGSQGVRMDPRVKNLLDMTLATMELKLSKAASMSGSSTSSLPSSSSAKKLCSPSTSSRHDQYQRKPSHYDRDNDRDRRSRSRSFSDRSFDEDYPRREPSHSSYHQREDYYRSASSTSNRSSRDREGSSGMRRYEDEYDFRGQRSRGHEDYYHEGGSSSRRYDDKERRYGYDR